MAMSELVRVLHQASDLVKAWGRSRLPDGRPLAEALTIREVPLWETVAVDLARLAVPQALSAQAEPSWFQSAVRPHLSFVKQTALTAWRCRPDVDACAAWPSAPTMLFLGFSHYIYRDVLEPIAQRIARREDVWPVVLSEGRGTMTAWPEGRMGAAQSLWGHWDAEVKVETDLLRREFRRTVAKLLEPGGLPAIITDQGQPLWSRMRYAFDWLFHAHLPLLLPKAALIRHILRRHRPALIVSPDVADKRGRLCCLLGRQLGIPSLEVQMGIYGPLSIEWRFLVADHLAVWGEHSKEELTAHGVPPERITITGAARHDGWATVSDAGRRHLRSALGVPERSAMVLFASVYYLHHYDDIVNRDLPDILIAMKKAFFEAAGRLRGLCLVVKPHPEEDVRETRQLAGAGRNIVFVDQHTDIRDLIREADAFVTFGSTSTVDALLANKLVITPVFPGWLWGTYFVNSGAILVPRSAEEVEQCLQMVADGSAAKVLADLDPARRTFLQRLIFKADGQASARIESLAMQMAGGAGRGLLSITPDGAA